MNKRILTLIIIMGAAVAAGGPAFAKKPESPGSSETQESFQHNSASSSAHQISTDSHNYFDDDRRAIIRNYYSTYHKRGDCPPGLARKNNGCQPPGQAKKWRTGETLPGDVAYADLPGALLHELGRTPQGEKLVQVGEELLLISVATGLVLDAFAIAE